MSENIEKSKKVLFSKKDKVDIAIKIGVNLFLAIVSVYLFEFWFDKISELPPLKMWENIGVVVMLGSTLFVAKTYYDKGGMNQFKRIVTTVLLASGTLGLMLLSLETVSDIPYPLAGIALTMITFYMIYVASGSIGFLGIIAISFGLIATISIGRWFDYYSWNVFFELLQISAVAVLFIGGIWSVIRMKLHGTRGTVKSGGGFGRANSGDANDGDGDTDDE